MRRNVMARYSRRDDLSEAPPCTRVLGVIGCEVLMDEVVHVLSKDKRLSTIAVIESPEGVQACQKLKQRAPDKRVVTCSEKDLWPLKSDDALKAVLLVMPISLHQSPADLREKVLEKLKVLQNVCDSILVFYGLCGNAFREIDRLSVGLGVPVTILRDSNDKIVDDCVGAILGGAEEYLQYLREEEGEYPLNSMWAHNWRHYMHETQILRDENDLEDAKMVFSCMGYAMVTKLDDGLADFDTFENEVVAFANAFELEIRRIDCPLYVVEQSYLLAKERLEKRTDERLL